MMPSLLVKPFALRQGVVFVGANLAQAAGLPGWAKILESLAAELPEYPPDAPYSDVAQYYEIAHSRADLVARLQDEFWSRAVGPTAVHNLIAALPARAIFTTGYDDLWSQAFAKIGIPVDKVTTDRPANIWNAAHPQLIQLFGDLHEPDSLILTTDDFEDFTHCRRWFINHLPGILQASAILCLGYEATDPDFRLLLRLIRKYKGDSPLSLYLLHPRIPQLVADDLKRRDVRLLTLPDNSLQAMSDWLSQFAEKIQSQLSSEKITATSGAARKNNTVVSNVPPLTDRLLGRDRELIEGVKLLKSQSSLPIILEGAAGMGKSAMARSLAHISQEESLYDYYISWSAHYEPRPLTALLDAIGKLLGHQTIDNASTYNDPTAMYKLLANTKCLLVITKVTALQHGEILDFLQRLPPSCRAIITTSSKNLTFGHSLYLASLDLQTSIAFARERAKDKGADGLTQFSDKQLLPLCQASGGLPVALSLAVGLVKSGVPLDEIVDNLKVGAGNFAVLSANVYNRLDRHTRELLNLICISRESVSLETLQGALQRPQSDLLEQITALTDLALVETQYADSRNKMRYAPSSRLIREYYNAAIRITQPEEDRRLRDAMATYYSEQAFLRGQEKWGEHDWLATNLKELQATFSFYDETQQWELLVALMKSFYYFLGVRGYWRERLEMGDRAGQAARRINDRQSEAEILVRIIGWTQMQLKKYVKAQEDIQRGQQIFAELNDLGGLASATCYLANLARDQGKNQQAKSLYEKAFGYALQAPDSARYQASVKLSWAMLLLRMKEFSLAEQYLNESLTIFKEIDHQSKVAELYCRLAHLYWEQDDAVKAEAYYQRSNEVAIPIGRQKTMAYNDIGLARIAYLRQEYNQAAEFAGRACSLFADLGLADELSSANRLRQKINNIQAGGLILTGDERSSLLRLMKRSFNQAELAELCMALDVDYEDLGDGNKAIRIIAFIKQMERLGRLPEMYRQIRNERPAINWPDLF